MIELVHLEKKYENATPLADVNAVIHDGDVISVIGPSGTGKSTLLRCINLLEKPTGGQILLDGTDITAPGYDVTLARRRMGETQALTLGLKHIDTVLMTHAHADHTGGFDDLRRFLHVPNGPVDARAVHESHAAVADIRLRAQRLYVGKGQRAVLLRGFPGGNGFLRRFGKAPQAANQHQRRQQGAYE